MSKRGTRSAKFIAGKDWSNGAKGNPVAKNMKLAKVLKKREFLKLKFDELISSFGLKSNEAYVKPYYYTFLKVLSSEHQQMVLKKINEFKFFTTESNIQFTIQNYIDNNYYLKDYSGLIETLGYNFDGHSRKELIENLVLIKKIDLPVESSIVLIAHLNFLIKNSDRSPKKDVSEKIEAYLNRQNRNEKAKKNK